MSPAEMISVVIPTYNRALFVKRAVETVLDQTWKNVEVIVIDDGSTDDTREVLRVFENNKAFRYFYQDNEGRSAARNKGTILSNADWICYLDSDDYLFPHALETLHNLKEKSQSDIVYANFLFTDTTLNKYTHEGEFIDNAIDKDLLMEVINSKLWLTKTGTYLIKKELALEIGGFATEFEPSEDLDYSIKVLMKTKASYTKEPVLYVERHEGNTDEREILHAIIKICKHYLAVNGSNGTLVFPEKINSEVKFILKYRIANGSYEINKHSQAFRYYMKMIGQRPKIVFDPFVFKQCLACIVPPSLKNKMKRNGRAHINNVS